MRVVCADLVSNHLEPLHDGFLCFSFADDNNALDRATTMAGVEDFEGRSIHRPFRDRVRTVRDFVEGVVPSASTICDSRARSSFRSTDLYVTVRDPAVVENETWTRCAPVTSFMIAARIASRSSLVQAIEAPGFGVEVHAFRMGGHCTRLHPLSESPHARSYRGRRRMYELARFRGRIPGVGGRVPSGRGGGATAALTTRMC